MNEDLRLLRKGLWPLSALYGFATAGRNALFDFGLRHCARVDVPVISVGNLAAGGTGKTPLVAWLVARMRAAGRRPGVLARGYGRQPGRELNDEGCLLAARFHDLTQIQDPDRVAGARRLVEAGVDLIILDDGFQHRRLHRDRDLVCLDTERPFAGGMLPVGLAREWPRGLRRADAFVLTRAGGYDPEDVRERMEQLRRYGPEDVRVFATDHVPARVRSMPDGSVHGVELLRGVKVHLLSAIARPETFEQTVLGLGADIVGHTRRRDHHPHTSAELSAVCDLAERDGARIVTTEKDEAKLAGHATPRWVLELELQFLGDEPSTEWLLERGEPSGDRSH